MTATVQPETGERGTIPVASVSKPSPISDLSAGCVDDAIGERVAGAVTEGGDRSGGEAVSRWLNLSLNARPLLDELNGLDLARLSEAHGYRLAAMLAVPQSLFEAEVAPSFGLARVVVRLKPSAPLRALLAEAGQ
jgi:hypothetical protein